MPNTSQQDPFASLDEQTAGAVAVSVLGGLPPGEQDALSVLSESNVDVQNAIRVGQMITETVAQSAAVNPSPLLRQQILSRIFGHIPSGAVILRLQATAKRLYRFAAVASLAFVGSSLLAAYFWNEQLTTSQQLVTAKQELEKIEKSTEIFASKAHQFDEYHRVIAQDQGLHQIKMLSVSKQPNLAKAQTVVYWNPHQREVYLEIRSLAPTTDSTDFQLWALVDGTPVDLGVFSVDDSSKTFLKMKNIDSADAFAITLEPKGGSTKPTLTDLAVMGLVR